MDEQLNKLSKEWLNWARKKFKDAETEEDAMGKRLIIHGGICYFNCAMDIKNLLESSTLSD